MGIKYLNGKRLKHAILAGAERVINTQDNLNKINVFPVPDGDTGTNMASTLAHISHKTINIEKPELSTLSEKIADSALNSARGNSGAIIAQFFQGLAESLESKGRIGLEQFSDAVHNATQKAKSAIANPVEGTIITVMHDWSEWIKKHWHKSEDFETLLNNSLDVAKISLKDTTHKLEALSKANVVDAGAQGFVNFLQGIVDCFKQGKPPHKFETIEKLKSFSQQKIHNNPINTEHHEIEINAQSLQSGELDFQYCTECIIQSSNAEIEEIRKQLLDWGNSQVVISGKDKIKIHIHTNDPNRLFQAMGQHGELIGIKADDMWAQFRNCIGWQNNREIAIVTDSSCALPQEIIVKYNINVVPLQVITKQTTYYDRINLNEELFTNLIHDDNEHVSTSQPVPVDIQNAINKARQQAKSALALMVSSGLSGTYQGTLQVCKQNADFPIDVIDTKTVSSGLGLLLMLVAEAAHNNSSREQILEKIPLWQQRITHVTAPKTLKWMIKSGRVSKPVGVLASALRLLPMILIDKQGTTQKKGMALGVVHARHKLISEIVKACKDKSNVRIIIAHAMDKVGAERMAEKFKKKLKKAEIYIVPSPASMVTGAGPGTISVALYCE